MGRVGCQGSTDRKKTFWHQLFTILKRGPIVYFKENYNFLRFQRGVYHFPEVGGPNFSRGCGVQMLISIEIYRICDFPDGPGPHTPLDLRMGMIDPLAISKFSSLH